MPLRISFDLDGALADFGGAFRAIESRLFDSEAERRSPGRRDAIWREIERTPDFWTTLEPLDARAVSRIHELMLRHKWEVVFITQRPATAGDTVQRQTQRWLADLGYDLPSVIVLNGSRGRAIRALDIDYHVDDTIQNCLDVVADSTARPILIAPSPSDGAVEGARKMGIAVAGHIGQALDILEEATLARTNPSLLQRLSTLVGWKIN